MPSIKKMPTTSRKSSLKERNNSADTPLAVNLMKQVLKIPFSPSFEGFSNS